jgi:serine/threonine protein kinase
MAGTSSFLNTPAITLLHRKPEPPTGMSPPADIWNLLISSGLATPSRAAAIRTQCEADLGAAAATDWQAVLDWLRRKKRISSYQQAVLAEGQPGPFQFGQYQVYAHIGEGPLSGWFRARHVPTQHPVRLFFVGGSDSATARTWHAIRQAAAAMMSIRCPFVSRCHEIVEQPDYRFLVFEDPPGRALSVKLPTRSRLPWPQTLQAIELLAEGLAEIHGAGLAHGHIRPESVWLQRNGICQWLWQIPDATTDPADTTETERPVPAFRPPRAEVADLSAGREADPQRDDLFALGALMYRMISGKPPRLQSHDLVARREELDRLLANCDKYRLPDDVQQLLRLLLTADLTPDLKDATVTARLAGAVLDSQSIRADVEPPPPTLADFEAAIRQKQRSHDFLQTLEALPDQAAEPATMTKQQAAPDFSLLESSFGSQGVSHQTVVRRKAKGSRWWPWATAGLILTTAILIGIMVAGPRSARNRSTTTAAGSAADPAAATDAADSDATAEEPRAAGVAAEAVTAVFRPQRIVEDDGDLLWESPTGGRPVDVSLMPAAPEFLVVWRPRRMANNPQATRLIKACGPQVQAVIEAWTTKIGFPADAVERMNLSFHGNQTGRFEAVVTIELVDPLPENEFWRRQGQPEIRDDPASGLRLFAGENQLFYFLPSEQKTVTRFAAGSPDFLVSALDSTGVKMAGRFLSRLIDRSDRDRDVTVIFRPAALLTEEGRRLFAGPLTGLRRPLYLFLDEQMEAVMWSLHFDEGSYLEWISLPTAGMKDDDLTQWLPARFDWLRDHVTDRVSRIPPDPHWSQVQLRIDNMLIELVRQFRVGREPEGVLANCWLPEAAPHNLVAATELVLNHSAAPAPSSTTVSVPASLEELLATPRDITIGTDPDLINLLQDIQQEVRDDYPDLPFEFRIHLLGNDLAVAGITQNQRPGNLQFRQRPLGEILAQIMFRANPDKSATGPADANCKLVWVIGPDPEDPSRRAVLVTTREAARQRDQQLPSLFQAPSED